MSQTEVQLIKDSAVVTADIADQAVTLDKLPHGTSSNDGKFLRANNGADPTFETVTGTTINNNADNRVITGSDTANTLNGESNLTFALSGSDPVLTVQGTSAGHAQLNLKTGGTTDHCSINFGDSGDGDIGEIRYTHSSDAMQFDTNNTERMRIDSSGHVGIGMTPSGVRLDVTSSVNDIARFSGTNSGGITIRNDTSNEIQIHSGNSDDLIFGTNGENERMRIDSSGRFLIAKGTDSDTTSQVQIGESAGGYTWDVGDVPQVLISGVNNESPTSGTLNIALRVEDENANNLFQIHNRGGGNSDVGQIFMAGNLGINTNNPLARIHIDTGHYLETSSGRATTGIHLDGTAGNQHEHGGGISFANGNTGAAAIASTQASSNSNQVALSIFNHQSSTGSDDSVEIARFGHNKSSIYIGKTNNEVTVASQGTDFTEGVGVTLAGGGNTCYNIFTANNNTTMYIGRQSSDGEIVGFFQNGFQEGSISVSGSTVSYNGGHLSRWSQLTGISETDKSSRPEIYQGTVMSNLDELCVWSHPDVLYTEQDKIDGSIPDGKDVGDIKVAAHTEDNQQLNKTKVSDTAGDKDVAGVFWAWDDDDDEYVNDFYIAMTGDMVIRVAASTTVARGDLLISAGDGTAKPQADDIVRSSTIAKIISTNHTATYPDGSKAYPCVLMAC